MEVQLRSKKKGLLALAFSLTKRVEKLMTISATQIRNLPNESAPDSLKQAASPTDKQLVSPDNLSTSAAAVCTTAELEEAVHYLTTHIRQNRQINEPEASCVLELLQRACLAIRDLEHDRDRWRNMANSGGTRTPLSGVRHAWGDENGSSK